MLCWGILRIAAGTDCVKGEASVALLFLLILFSVETYIIVHGALSSSTTMLKRILCFFIMFLTLMLPVAYLMNKPRFQKRFPSLQVQDYTYIGFTVSIIIFINSGKLLLRSLHQFRPFVNTRIFKMGGSYYLISSLISW